MMWRTYTELSEISSFEDRFEYLKLSGAVGARTFGGERWLNQQFYRSHEWRTIRYKIIARDLGCDLGVEDHEIHDKILIHHMNPITPRDLIDVREEVLNPEFLISVSHNTHNAIHYGDASLLPSPFVERTPGDTRLW